MDPKTTPATQPSGQLRPGDEAPPGTPGSGDDICPRCGGTGRLQAGERCPECDGSGHVTSGIGGG